MVNSEEMCFNREEEKQSFSLLSLASEVVAAYVSNNTARSEEVAELILKVHGTLVGLAGRGESAYSQMAVRPAVPIEHSVTQDYIVCLEDGRKMKMLKRHLRKGYNLTPEQYRERWNLPPDYPMVAPSYARKRSALAKMNGLGLPPFRREQEAYRSA